MQIIHTYIFKKLCRYTAILIITLVGIVWLLQALRFMDIIIQYDVPFFDFFRFMGYLLPDLLSNLLPLTLCLSALVVYGKLHGYHEINAFFALRFTPWELAKPLVLWGGILSMSALILNLWIVPASFQAFKTQEHKFKSQFTSALIKPGQFNMIQNSMFYIRERTADDLLIGVLVYGVLMKNSNHSYVVTATKGRIIRSSNDSKIILRLSNGQYQTLNSEMSTVFTFKNLSLDLSPYVLNTLPRETKAYEKSVQELLGLSGTLPLQKCFLSEGHQRLFIPFLNIINALICSFLLISGRRLSHKIIIPFCFLACLVFQLLITLLINCYTKHEMYLWGAYFLGVSIIVLYSIWIIQLKRRLT